MKKILNAGCLCIFALLVACSDWMDVSPKTDVKSDDLFLTESGFKSALIGIYARMTNNETYGLNLTSGFMERLVQRYDNYSSSTTIDSRAKIYNYTTEANSKNTINNIWLGMYRNIANINNLLENLETNGNALTTEGYYELIKGEALGLRAFHYFDLLRLWGPIYQEDSTANAVPWRDQFTPVRVPLMPANELVAKILDDLYQAEELLENDSMKYTRYAREPFRGERNHRMNKYAVKALLARVNLYIGNKTEAAGYAREVINECGLKLVRDNRTDNAMLEESLFALNMYEMEERYESIWHEAINYANNREYWITLANAQSIFDANSIGINDIRYKSGYGFVFGNNQLMCRKYLPSPFSRYTGNIPLIRLSEMYYILAESVALADSPQYINTVRNNRGISRSSNIQADANYTEALRIDALQREYQKDFFAEGQFFYFLKRHHAKTFYRCPVVGDFDAYVFPVPDDEVEFGLTD